SALNKLGIKKGETVSFLCPNIPPMFEAHFGVPMSGGVLNAINTLLHAEAVAFILQHAETKVLLVDREFAEIAEKALKMVAVKPIVIDIDDHYYPAGTLLGSQTYDQHLEPARTHYDGQLPNTEWAAITLSYASGTTGNPKGVV